MPARLIRRKPLTQRIIAYLSPLDFFLWLSAELDSSDWDQCQARWVVSIGITFNFVFLIARANNGLGTLKRQDDVFKESKGHIGWLKFCASFVVHLLTLLSLINALYTFWRKRHYRLFENPLDAPPSTPSAHRVRVDSSSHSLSWLRLSSNIFASNNAESRSYSEATKDVWELSVWDPASLSLRLFCLFSPGHVLVYWILLPAALEGSRPSVAISTIIVLIGLLSTQLYMLQTYFVQQSKDSSVLHKEVLNEYDIKFVHPRTQKHVRDVGTQFTSSREATEGLSQCKGDDNYVDLYTPIIAVNRGFHTQPNPHYVSHLDPGAPKLHTSASVRASSGVEPGFQTPDHPHDESSPLRSSAATRQPNLGICRPGDGGSLGVYSHANSPLRKAPSANFVEAHRQRERSLKPVKRINGAYERYGSVEGLGGLGLLQTHSHSARRGRARSGERI